MNTKLKNILQVLAGILLLIGSLSLVTTQSGKELQVKFLRTYISAEATAVETFTEEYESFGKSGSNHVHEWRVYLSANYTVDDIEYPGMYWVKSYPYYDHKEAELFAKEYMKTGDALTVYHDPKSPEESVLHQEDEMHPWLDFLVVLLMTWSALIITWGCMNLFMKKRKTVKEKKKSKIRKRENGLLSDYYSGALQKKAIQKWDGYYCQIFLLKNSVVIIHDENKFHYCRQYSFQEFLDQGIIGNALIEEPEIRHKKEILEKIKGMIAEVI